MSDLTGIKLPRLSAIEIIDWDFALPSSYGRNRMSADFTEDVDVSDECEETKAEEASL